MPVKDKITFKIPFPDKVNVSYKNKVLEVKGPKGMLTRKFENGYIEVKATKNEVIVETILPRKKDFALAGTWRGHITNMIKGVQKDYEYELKIVYAHFPIKTSVKGDNFLIENFLGERHPRNARIMEGSKVKVSGEKVNVSGIDLEAVSQTATNIEQATKIKRYDPRVFQDGIYIIEKRR